MSFHPPHFGCGLERDASAKPSGGGEAAEGVSSDVMETVGSREGKLSCLPSCALLEVRDVDGVSMDAGEHQLRPHARTVDEGPGTRRSQDAPATAPQAVRSFRHCDR